MAFSRIGACFTPGFRRELLKWLRVFQCYFMTILTLPIFLLVGAAVLIYRLFLTIYLKLVHESKFILCAPSDAPYAVEKHANTSTIHAFIFVKGQTDILTLEDRLLRNVIGYRAKDGGQPYLKLTWKLSIMHGFFVWGIENETFDIRDHVRLCPGTNNTIYSEKEVHEAIEKLADDLIDPKRPRWELLFIPKVKMDKKGDDLHYAIIFRVQHAYMDGMSLLQLMRIGFLDEPGALTIDPVNPPIPKVSKLELIALYLQAFVAAPYILYKTSFFCPPNIFQEAIRENKGPKFIGCSNKEITLESVKLIRQKFNCSTIALFNSVINGALRRAAKRKNLPIPEEIDFAYTIASLPYPNEDPQNRFTVKILKSPIAISDSVKRLKEMNPVLRSVKAYEILVLCGFTLQVIGRLPAALIEKMGGTLTSGYVVTNMPGFMGKQMLNGDQVEEMYGFPPLICGLGFGVGICSYNGRIRAAWMAEKSKIISSREEMNALMADFENEFSYLECIANEN